MFFSLIFILTLASALTSQLTDITTNPGLLAIESRPAKLVEGYHTLTHYYRLTDLIDQVDLIRLTYEQTLQVVHTEEHTVNHVQLLITTINTTFSNINEKLDNLRVPTYNRTKRGLIDGLGSIVKFITGNLDAQDEKRYNEIIGHLQKNQESLQSQLKSQYSINEAVQKSFQDIKRIITHNNQELRKELSYLKTTNTKFFRLSTTYALLEHYQIVLNLILDVLQDVENSLTACNSGILHPSVISTHNLKTELTKLSKYYQDRFLDFSGKNLLEIQTSIKVKCFIGTEEIIYFLDIPIVNPTTFKFYQLQSIPTSVQSEYMTIIPALTNFLKADDKIIPLTSSCPVHHYYLCPNYLISPLKTPCEQEFLQSSSTTKCNYIKITTDSNHVSLLSDINQYLLFLPHEDTLTIVKDDIIKTQTLQGIFLISPGKNHILYNNSTLFAPHNDLVGKPILVTDITLQLTPPQEPKQEIHLKNLDFSDIQLHDIQPIQPFKLVNFTLPSIWTVLLYLLLTALFSYTGYRFYRHTRTVQPATPE